MTRTLVLVTAVLAAVAGPAAAQSPATQAAAAPAPIVPSVASSIPVGSRVGLLSSTYEDGGRRDPFSSLVVTRRVSAASRGAVAGQRVPLADVALADVEVRGIVRSGATMLAILEGPNKQSFVTRVKDRLVDASVVSIDANGVVFNEQVDGNGTTSQVRKSLRPAGEGIR
jgi:Tfp pilus assembly protein PilP